ncbi:alkaline phosphatase family protein [Vibrio splendidus]|uniref:alkaline phosphatase family protein n=1 Tax=Vibrio splendidus TaxID=29497 RepID=UPI001FB53D6E|nr:alkaline phosphatase family protein [Vibrio splendidus]UOE88712.1 alkaline phosphatase family protein [Vibrio splendidus]
MSNNKVILILIDALRSDYITEEDAPFLYKFSRENRYYKNVTQSRSFCERAEIFTGLSPRESGYFSAIGYCPEESPYQDLKMVSILSFLDKRFSKSRYFRAVKNRIIPKLTKSDKAGMRSYSIPVQTLKYFSLTEDKYDFREEKAFDGRDNIFKDCREQGLNIFYDSFTALNFTNAVSDDSRLDMVEKNIDSDFSLYLTYIGIMDSCAHTYGPQSNERKSELKNLDEKLSSFYENIKLKNKDAKFIFLGDHGMADVHTKVDIGKEINDLAIENNLVLGEDYVYFLDSTMFRVWYLNPRAHKAMDVCLKNNRVLNENGVFVDENTAIRDEIPFPDERYGHSLWMANLGVLIFPDFFHNSKAYKGMHGYSVEDISSKGTCIVSSDEFEHVENIKLTDVYDILKKELDII